MLPKEYFKAAGLSLLFLLAVIALIGAYQPEAKITLLNNPPASITLELYNGELLVQPLDKNEKSTKTPGSITVDISRVDTMTDGVEEISSTPQLSTMARIDNFDMYYINHLGYDINIYAARTGVHLPTDQQVYITRVTYYPDGERYHLHNSTFSRGDEQV